MSEANSDSAPESKPPAAAVVGGAVVGGDVVGDDFFASVVAGAAVVVVVGGSVVVVLVVVVVDVDRVKASSVRSCSAAGNAMTTPDATSASKSGSSVVVVS